ncbi:transducin family protein / WD-40 repeat family protein [Euphorbia peplus]|nr:transducin family protein / WD-40 repeat family protein [Euphorbia peplus]
MTKKLTPQLDLDSFLTFHSTSDDDTSSVPHRSLDEILNQSDSSTSPSPPSSPLPHHLPSLPLPQSDTVSDDSSESQFHNRPTFSRVSSAAFSGDPVWRVPSSSSSRPLPSLFGVVRSNAKPGAALAAAAAASRSVPTPHAAAIKSRRAVIRRKALDSAEAELSSLEVVSSLSTEVVIDRTRLSDRFTEDDDSMSDFQSAVDSEVSVSKQNFENTSEGFVDKDTGSELEATDKIEEQRVRDEQDLLNAVTSTSSTNVNLDFDAISTNVGSGEGRSEVISALSDDTNSKFLYSNDVTDYNDETVEAHSTMETLAVEDGIRRVEADEAGLAAAVDDETSSLSDIAELVEERIGQMESERISRRAEEKHRPTMKPLELAEELEKKQASTGLHWEEGAAAQPMKLEGVRRGSTTLGYFDIDGNNTITRTIGSQAFRRDHGSPQVLAVHLNYIAVGMAKGVIVVVPSRYSPYNVDNLDAKMLILGLQGDRSLAPVTSMCFNQQGDLLLAGYGDGHITVWDVQRATAVKVITGDHTAPVVHALFLGQDSQVTRQFKAVTGDSKGLVLLHAFSVVPLLNRFSIKTTCLLDGQKTGTVLSASPLLFDESFGAALSSSQGNASLSAGNIGNMMGGVVGGDAGWKLFSEGSSVIEEGVVILVTHHTALVVRLTPTLKVYAQLLKPDGVREGSMPYTAWKCTIQPSSSSSENATVEAVEHVSFLAIAWDRKVQVAKLVKSELRICGTWSVDSAAIGVVWLDAHMLVVLTLTGQLYLFAKDGTIIHQTSFAVDGSGGDDLVAYHTHFINIYGNPEKSYHNCLAIRGASLYMLGPMHLVVSRLLPWKERIQVLRRAGDWMGALNMGMTLYDGQAHGVIDLPRSLDAVQETVMPYLVELLLSYVEEVFSYISVAFCNQIGKVEQDDLKSGSSTARSEIKEQFSRVGGVAVEFCVHIKRTDILFDDIFSKFVAIQQRDTFLELLEPYILKDMLGSLPPEIMQALVEHYSSKGWLQRVEQCVLHMDISSLDFNQVVRLCREHGLYGALVYLFNKGLDDFRAPLEELLIVLRNSAKESAAALGYRMLVYLKYCFSGLAFPPGHGALSAKRLPSLRTELIQFLLENSSAPNTLIASRLSARGMYLNLYHLLELDTEATLDVLRLAFLDDGKLANYSANGHMEIQQENATPFETENFLAQDAIDALVKIIEVDVFEAVETATADDDTGSVKPWPSKKDMGNLFEFIADHVARRKAHVPSSILSKILEYLTSDGNFSVSNPEHGVKTLKQREKQVLALLEVVPETEWNSTFVLELCEKASFHQVCGFIYTIRSQYVAALDCYMKDVDEPIHTFCYINNTLQQLNISEQKIFLSAIMSRIPELVVLCRAGTFLLVIDHFSSYTSQILSELHSHPKSLFLYLKTVIEVYLSGTLDFSGLNKDGVVGTFSGREVKEEATGLQAYWERISEFPKFIRNNPVHVTDDMIELYMELLCQYERNSVLKFLETFDSYRVEHCLRLCQEYGITNAAAFLLERVGDVGSALLLAISSLNDKFTDLDAAVESAIPTMALSGSTGTDLYNIVSQKDEVGDIRNILNACIGLCQRNTPRLQPEESETLWFRLLDSFCSPLMDSYVDKKLSKGDNYVGKLDGILGDQADEDSVIKWKISKSHKGAHVLRKLFSQFIKEIVEGMIGYVRLPTIMSKLLSDNGGQEFGDFKITILGMLGTYGFERRILDTAKSLIEDDTFYTMSLLKKGASHGYAPRSLMCCICNCLLTKNSPSFQIRIFNCGHATHLQCEYESESSKSSLSGCPLCMPKKNSQRPRNKSVQPENGLLNKISTRYKRTQGTASSHPYEDSLDNSYGQQHVSRFEILTSLQKDRRLVQIETMPQLRLAPPAVYHERIKKGHDLLAGESSSSITKVEKSSKMRASARRFQLKSSIFGKERSSRR